LLSRLHRKAEALDQACLRVQGHPHDYAIRQELLSALEWEDSLHPEHARPLIRDLFKQVRSQSTELSRRIGQNDLQASVLPIADIRGLRQRLTRLLQVLAVRHSQPHQG
jgi:hypothetical protein